MRYLYRVPRKVKDGHIVCHNKVKPHPTPTMNGFRVFLEPVSEIGHYAICDCGWAPHLPEHYIAKAIAELRKKDK